MEKRSVFAAALLLGFLPFLAPLLHAMRRYGAAQARLGAAGLLAVAFAAVLSLVLGGSTMGRDLSQRRLGFYLARPLSALAIWGGKFLGIWSIVIAGAFLIVLPVGLVDFSLWWALARSAHAGELVSLFVGSVVVALAAGTLVGAASRAKSTGMLADLVALAVFALSMGWVLVPLVLANAPILLTRVVAALAIGIALALLAAGFARVAIGRMDAARGNRARSVVLWAFLLTLAAGCMGYVRRLLSPSPEDLTSVSVQDAAARGSWIEIEGRARGRADLMASFFYDVASGRFVRLREGRQAAVAFSEDATTAAWTERAITDRQGRERVLLCRLGKGETVRTPIEARPWNLVLSPDGSRLAVLEERTVSVYETPSGRLLAAPAFGSDDRQALRFAFLGPNRLRLYRLGPAGQAATGQESRTASIEVLDLNLSTRRLERTALIEGLRRPFSLAFDDRGERVIAREQAGGVSLFDASSGARIASPGEPGWDRVSKAFLSDGRPVIAEATGGNGRVHLFSRDGLPERVFEVGRAGAIRIGAEPAAGQLTLAISPAPELDGPADTVLLDLTSGVLRKLAKHARPVASRMHWRLPWMEPGSGVTRLIERDDGTLLSFDPAAGSLTPLLKKPRS